MWFRKGPWWPLLLIDALAIFVPRGLHTSNSHDFEVLRVLEHTTGFANRTSLELQDVRRHFGDAHTS